MFNLFTGTLDDMGFFAHLRVSLFLLFLSEKVLCKNEDTSTLCPIGKFYDELHRKCQMCSPCNPNEISIKKCGEKTDTECERYTDFVDFSFLTNNEKENNSGKVTTDKVKFSPPEVIQANEEEKQWKTLAFVLIGMISALVIVATVIVIISCHRFRNYQWLCKAVTTDQGT